MNAASAGTAAATGGKPPPLTIRHPGFGDMREALRRGIDDWRACHSEVPLLAVLAPVAAICLSAVVTAPLLMPFVFPVCAGLALLGPIATIWFACLSRAREQTGAAPSAEEAAAVFDTPRRIIVQNLGLIAIGIYLLWLTVAGILYFQTVGSNGPSGGFGFFASIFTTGAGWTMTIVGCVIGAVFAVIMLSIGLVSFPLALDRDVTTWQALATAFSVMARNPAVVLIWGALVAAALVIGIIPALLGLAFVMPILGHATWHMYRRLVA